MINSFTLSSLHFTLYSLLFTLYSLLFTLYSLLLILNKVKRLVQIKEHHQVVNFLWLLSSPVFTGCRLLYVSAKVLAIYIKKAVTELNYLNIYRLQSLRNEKCKLSATALLFNFIFLP